MLATHDPALLEARRRSSGRHRSLRHTPHPQFCLRDLRCVARQQQCDAPFPGLRSQPWWDAREFEWAETVEAGAAVIGSELSRFEASAASAEDGVPQ